jgi:hypothetical protein
MNRMSDAIKPIKPVFPESRVLYESLGGDLFFDNQAELDQWKAEPLWRKMLGKTAYNRKLEAALKSRS